MAVNGPRKVLLVNYAGYFLCANTFIPDNSLGTLAAMLKRHGVPVEILDLQSPSAVGSIMDHTSQPAAQALVDQLTSGQAPESSLVRRYQEDRRHGEEWLVADATRRILAKIADEGIGLVGFKLWAGDGLMRAIHMAEAIRDAYPEVRLVAGGPAVHYCGEHLRSITQVFDHLVVGEGEHVLLALATGEKPLPKRPSDDARRVRRPGPVLPATLAGKDLPPLRRRESDGAVWVSRLDDLPFAVYDRDVYPSIDEFYRLRIVDDTRGCFNRCAFCSHAHMNGFGTRKRRAVAVVDEMQRLQETEGVSHFRLSGSNPPWRFVVRVAEEILRRRLQVHYSIFASMNNVHLETLGLLRASGLRAIFFGVESGDEGLLRRAYNKTNGSPEQVVRVCQTAMQHGIFVALSFILPGPFETEATKRASLELIERIFARHSQGSVLVLPGFLAPGSRWWDRMEEYGFEFTPGMDRNGYAVQGVRLSSDYLLPRETWADFGYRLDGKSVAQLLNECQDFVRAVRALGVLTEIDDTGYLLALMGDLDPRVYREQVIRQLVLGGERLLRQQVRGTNQRALESMMQPWITKPAQPSAA
jgi:radical SAM superfamily enzyme YgiQ (UPF0313 family)